MKRSTRNLAFGIGAVIGGLMLANALYAPLPDTPQMDSIPTSLFTAPARTARPSRPVPTPTGTRAATPTIPAGLYLYSGGPGAGCSAEGIPLMTPAPWDYYEEAVYTGLAYDADYTVDICSTLNYPVELRVNQQGRQEGVVVLYSADFVCRDPHNICSTEPSFDADRTEDITHQLDGHGGWAHERQYSRTYDVVIRPAIGTPPVYRYVMEGFSRGALGYFCSGGQYCPGDTWASYDVSYIFDANPPGDPPDRDTDRDPWITEILARPQGTTCGDWNLRGGCGNNDQFIEVGVPEEMSLADYRLDVLNGASEVVCTYTIASDNLTEPLKAFWQDMMGAPGSASTPTPTPTGTITPAPTGTDVPAGCGLWPETGSVKLYDPDGVLLDTRAYDYSGGGQYGDSWAAMDWQNPDGPWWWYSPTSGRANRIPPTTTPTASPTP